MSELWRSKLAQFYIKWGDKLPFAKGYMLSEFRRIKKKMARESQETFERTRPPQGSDIRFLSIRIYDIFQIEYIEELLKGLKKLFPDFYDPFLSRDNEKFIRKAAGMTSGGWLNIGCVYREKKGRVFSGTNRVLSNLPDEVDFIEIALHKVLPSVFALTYDVVLEDCATTLFHELQSSLYIPDVQFRRIIPFGRVGGGYSMLPSDIVMQLHLANWHLSLRKCFCQSKTSPL